MNQKQEDIRQRLRIGVEIKVDLAAPGGLYDTKRILDGSDVQELVIEEILELGDDAMRAQIQSAIETAITTARDKAHGTLRSHAQAAERARRRREEEVAAARGAD